MMNTKAGFCIDPVTDVSPALDVLVMHAVRRNSLRGGKGGGGMCRNEHLSWMQASTSERRLPPAPSKSHTTPQGTMAWRASNRGPWRDGNLSSRFRTGRHHRTVRYSPDSRIKCESNRA